MNTLLTKDISHDALELIAYNSFINCHCKGVDSVLFTDIPGARIRMFIANEQHELWKNDPARMTMSVGLHPHHCDVTLIPVFGLIYNLVEMTGQRGQRVELNRFKYHSPILNKASGSFFLETPDVLFRLGHERLNGPTRMNAEELHSVYVARNERAAWFVIEGRENVHYDPVCYSNDDLELFSFHGLNEPMSVSYLIDLLKGLKNS